MERVLQPRVPADGGTGGQQGGEGLGAAERGEPVLRGLLQADDSGHGRAFVPVAGCLPAPGGAVSGHRAVLHPQHGVVVVQQAAAREGLHPPACVRALARTAPAEEQVAPPLQRDAGGVDGHGVADERGLRVEDAQHGRERLAQVRVLRPQEGCGVVEGGVRDHHMHGSTGRGAVADFRAVAVGGAQQAHMPHVVGRLAQQLRALSAAGKGQRGGKQPEDTFPLRARAAPERAEGGQQRLRVPTGGKGDGEQKSRHPEKIFVSHLRFPVMSLIEVQNASPRA